MALNLCKTAWQDDSELALVRNWFYPDRSARDPYDTASNQDMRHEAVARVNIWTFKSHRVPPAVLSTANLNDSILHFERLDPMRDPNSYRSVQYMFAFAFLRFVNSFVDRDIARGKHATLSAAEEETEEDRAVKAYGESSMYAHAISIGMPENFVDLRHQVTHGKVPGVALLRNAADEALEWLWQRWWKPNATGDASLAEIRFNSDGS